MLSGATCLVSNGNNISSRASPTMKARQILKRDKRPRPVLVCCFVRFAAYDVKKADKLPLETEPVARDNNTILTLKRGDQTLSRLTQLIIVVSESKTAEKEKLFLNNLMPYHHFFGKSFPREVSTTSQNKENTKSSVPFLFCSLILSLQVTFANDVFVFHSFS